MKRLIRSELYTAFKQRNGRHEEIFKNPTLKEIEFIRKENNGAIRGVITNGDIYIWNGFILHNSIYNNVDISQFRFSYKNSDGWLIDAHNKYTVKEILLIINENKNVLSQIGDFNNLYDIVYTIDDIPEISSLKDLENKYLNKQAELADAFMKNKLYIEIFKNPTLKEIEICKDSYYNGFRGIIESNGDVYCWGMDIMHDNINLYTKLNLDIFNIRFYAEGDIMYVYTTSKQNKLAINYYFKEYKNIFTNKYKYNFYNFNNINENEIYSYEEIINLMGGK